MRAMGLCSIFISECVPQHSPQCRKQHIHTELKHTNVLTYFVGYVLFQNKQKHIPF